MFLICILLNIAIFLALDSIWFRLFAGDFFRKHMAKIALIKNDSFTPRIIPALFVYILMAFSLEYFVFFLPITYTVQGAIANSALMGLITFGIYDFTNRAVLKDYPFILSIVDTSWGVFVFAATGYLRLILKPLIVNIIG